MGSLKFVVVLADPKESSSHQLIMSMNKNFKHKKDLGFLKTTTFHFCFPSAANKLTRLNTL